MNVSTLNVSHAYPNKSWTNICLWCAQICLWLTLLCLPFSHFLVNQAVSLSALFVIISGDYRQKWNRIKQYKSVIWILLFVLMVGVSLSYSSAPLSKAFSFFNKYTKLLYIIFLLHICQTPKRRQISLNILVCSIFAATCIALLNHIGWVDYSFTERWQKILPMPGVQGFFINIIHVSVLQAFAIYVLIMNLFRKGSILSAIGLIFLAFYLFYINGERTGCFPAIVLIYLAFIVHLYSNKKVLFKALSLLTLAIIFILASSPRFLSKMHQLDDEFTRYVNQHHYNILHIRQFIHGHSHLRVSDDMELGSTGLRIEFIKGSVKLIQEKPWIGHGVGSFMYEYNRIHGALIPGSTGLSDPHNAFLMIAVQVGFLGLLLFLIFIVSLGRDIWRLPFFEKGLGIGLGILFVMNSLTNATLLDNTVGYLYVTVTAILLSSLPAPSQKTDQSTS
jgi:O-antigen ligase